MAMDELGQIVLGKNMSHSKDSQQRKCLIKAHTAGLYVGAYGVIFLNSNMVAVTCTVISQTVQILDAFHLPTGAYHSGILERYLHEQRFSLPLHLIWSYFLCNIAVMRVKEMVIEK